MKRTLSGLALALAALSPFLASAAGADAALVKRGEYLARAADCMACHTAPTSSSPLLPRASARTAPTSIRRCPTPPIT